MKPDRKALISLLTSFITEYPKGSIIPDQIMHFFLDQYTSHALRDKWLATDMFAQWLSGEYDFPADDVTRLIEENRDIIREKAGVEILLPGEEHHPEAGEYEEDEKLELADYTESAPIQKEKMNHAPVARIKPEKSVVRKKVRKKIKRSASAAPPALKPKEAMRILASMVSHKPNVEEVIAQLITDKVLTGNFEREICKADAPQTGVNLTIGEALCWLLILEVDHAQYSRLRRIGGVILKHAVRQTKELLEAARGQLETLNKTTMEAAKSGEIANLSAIKGIADRLEAAISQQK